MTCGTFLFLLTDIPRRAYIALFPPNGAWLLIFDSHLRLAEYGRLRIDPFSIAPAGFFLFRYCRDSVSSL